MNYGLRLLIQVCLMPKRLNISDHSNLGFWSQRNWKKPFQWRKQNGSFGLAKYCPLLFLEIVLFSTPEVNTKARVYGHSYQARTTGVDFPMISFVVESPLFISWASTSHAKAYCKVHKKPNKRKSRSDECESSWLAKRRRLVSKATATCNGDAKDDLKRSALALKLWTDKHRREVKVGFYRVFCLSFPSYQLWCRSTASRSNGKEITWIVLPSIPNHQDKKNKPISYFLTSVPALQWGMEAAKQGILPVNGKKMKRDLKEHDENKSNLREKYLADREKSHFLSHFWLGSLSFVKALLVTNWSIMKRLRSQCDFEYFGCKVLKFSGEVSQFLSFQVTMFEDLHLWVSVARISSWSRPEKHCYRKSTMMEEWWLTPGPLPTW